MRIQLHVPNLAHYPINNVQKYYLQFLPIFNIALDGEEEPRYVFVKRNSDAVFKFKF